MRRERGFTFVEVLLALLVLGIVITTTMAMFVERQKRLQTASETILAWQALANETEIRRRLPYDTLESGKLEFMTPTDILAPLAPYTTMVTVSPPENNVKTVTLTIRWRNGTRVERLSIKRVDTGGSGLW